VSPELAPRIKELCSLIAKEKDQKKFLELVAELNQLLAEKEERLKQSAQGFSPQSA
jgi:hypothetical protein